MITIFNRKEVCITYDMKFQAEVREILNAHGIKYIFRIVDQNRGRTRGGSLGMDLDRQCEYKIYVHKDDYEEALHLIRK